MLRRILRGTLRWGLRLLALLVLLPIVAVLALLAALNVAPGQHYAAGLAARLTGGMVTLTDLHGRFPDALRVGRIQVADGQGVWLTVDDVQLDWSPLALISRDAHVQLLAAASLDVARLPVSAPPAQPQPASGGAPFRLPVRVDLDSLHVARVTVGAPVAGVPIAAALDGQAHLASLQQGSADVTLHAADGSGTYHLQGAIDPSTIRATLTAREKPAGLVAGLAHLPDPTGLSVDASLDGPWTAAATTLAVSAGALGAQAHGTLDLRGFGGDLTLAAHAPAMTPAPGVSFAAATLQAHVSGPFAAPDATGTLHVSGLQAAGAAVAELSADIAGNRGALTLQATADGTRIPGPALFADDPVHLVAHAMLAQPGRPVTFDLSHRLLRVTGRAVTGRAVAADTMAVTAHVEVPDLAPLAAIGHVDLQGHAAFDATASLPPDGSIPLTLEGTLGLTGGIPQAVALIGGNGHLDMAATLHGSDLALSRLRLNGQDVALSASGALSAGVLQAKADLAVPDLHVVQPTVRGAAHLAVQVSGPLTDLSAQADLSGDVATKGVPSGHVEAKIDARGLPGAPAGRVQASGMLDGAPVALAAEVRRDTGGALSLTIQRGDWKSAHAEGALTLPPGATLPTGHIAMRMARLDDLRRLTGQALTGSVSATVDLAPNKLITAQVRADQAGLPGTASVRRVALDARVTDPLGAMVVAATLDAQGIQAGKIGGNAKLRADGPQSALRIAAQADAQGVAGGPARLTTQATLNLPAHSVSIASLQATARGQTARLLAPARVTFGSTVAVDRLRVGLRDAVLDLAGRVSPTLDLTASLDHVTADLARIADPDLQATGQLSARARLTGTPQRPAGSVHLEASGLRMRTGPAASLPAASVVADATLAGRTARIDAHLQAGANRVTVTGTAPIDPAASFDLRATGGLDLRLLDPILTAQGRRVLGTLTLDAEVRGTLAAPRASGSARLAGGEVQDFAQGLHISDIDALIQAEGDHLTLAHLTARAGDGTIGAGGTVGLAAPMPVDLHLTMTRAKPLAGDELTAVLDSQLALRGNVEGRLDAAGRITIERADIQIPEHLPPSIAVLNVRVPGQKPPPPPSPGPDIGLDLTLHAPGRIFVRGRGIDAELRGDLHLGGTAAHPQPSGGFEMVRGSISVAGTTLTFTTGKVTFDGSGKLDPVLDFVASSTSGSVTANLIVGGYASAPKITLSSTPELPQDEVLAHLLFGQPASSLSPFQLGEIALAIAQLTGGPGSGFDPLASARKALGLDRLSVGGGSGGNAGGASVQAGRYVAPGVYLGAKQGTGGGGTQAQVQIDLYKGLKLETDVGTGGGSATGGAQSSSGTSVGLTYQFEY